MRDAFNFKKYFQETVQKFVAETKVHQLILSIDQDIVLEYGSEIHSWTTLRTMIEDLKKFDLLAVLLEGKVRFNKVSTIEQVGNSFSIFTFSIFKNSSTMRVIFLFEQGRIPFEEDFKNFIEYTLNFYLNIPREDNVKVFEIYPEFNLNIMKQIESCFNSKDEQGILSHFHIQDLAYYYNYTGEQFALEINNEIKKEIRKFLKNKDLFFRFSQNSYITYSHNCSLEIVKERYKEVLFELNFLVIRFDLNFFPIDHKNFQKQSFWNNVFDVPLTF